MRFPRSDRDLSYWQYTSSLAHFHSTIPPFRIFSSGLYLLINQSHSICSFGLENPVYLPVLDPVTSTSPPQEIIWKWNSALKFFPNLNQRTDFLPKYSLTQFGNTKPLLVLNAVLIYQMPSYVPNAIHECRNTKGLVSALVKTVK